MICACKYPFIIILWWLDKFFNNCLQKIEEFQNLMKEIMSLHITVPLSMFCLDCTNLNIDLFLRAKHLKERLVLFEVDENRDLNRS